MDNMTRIYSSLPDVTASETTLDSLPDVRSSFLVPQLTDKPQNPIMDTLRVRSDSRQYSESHMSRNVSTLSTKDDEAIHENIACQMPGDLEPDFVWHQATAQIIASRVSP